MMDTTLSAATYLSATSLAQPFGVDGGRGAPNAKRACNRDVLNVRDAFVAAEGGAEDQPIVPRDGACLAYTLCTPSAAYQVRF